MKQHHCNSADPVGTPKVGLHSVIGKKSVWTLYSCNYSPRVRKTTNLSANFE